MNQMKHMTTVWDDESMTPIAFFERGGKYDFQFYFAAQSMFVEMKLLYSFRYGIV